MPKGRPTLYRRDTARRVLAAIEATGSLEKACEDPTLPSHVTVQSWVREHEGFSSALTRAREAAAHTQAGLALAEAAELADDARTADVPRARVRAVQHLGGVRQWLAERWNRAAYAPSPGVALNISAGEGSSLTFASVLQQGQAAEPPTPQCSLEATLEAGSTPALEAGGVESPPPAPATPSQDVPACEGDSRDADADA